jgi:hydroxypyruvate reductase
VERYRVRGQLPAAVLAVLAEKDSAAIHVNSNQDVIRVIGDNAAAVAAAAAQAARLGMRSDVVWRAVEGEAAKLGQNWAAAAAQASASVDVLLGGGEATVTVHGTGLGGRNTEFVLAAAIELERRDMDDWVIASLATDGQDALTGAAGAIADGGSCMRARRAGVDPEMALANNDSLAVFDAAGGTVVTGPTGTNVNDLYFAVRARHQQSLGVGGD